MPNCKYRVDVSTSKVRTPCGMNSIKYMGNDASKALAIYRKTVVGFDAWNRPNLMCGVIYSVWNEEIKDFVVKRNKGFGE